MFNNNKPRRTSNVDVPNWNKNELVRNNKSVVGNKKTKKKFENENNSQQDVYRIYRNVIYLLLLVNFTVD